MTTRTIALLALALLAAPAVAGTWGAGSFQSDHALDTASDWAEAGSPRAIAMALERACAAEYLESPDGEEAVVAAEVVAASLGRPNARLPEDLAAWIGRQPEDALRTLADPASAALSCVRDPETSELRQLWADGDDAEWLRHMDDLAARLAGEAPAHAAR